MTVSFPLFAGLNLIIAFVICWFLKNCCKGNFKERIGEGASLLGQVLGKQGRERSLAKQKFYYLGESKRFT